MNKAIVLSLCATVLAAPAAAETLIPVKPPLGGENVNVEGINDSYIIAGSYDDQNGTHCFFGPANGQYQTYDVKSARLCQPYAINNRGAMTGYSDKGAFVANSGGKVTFVTKNGVRINQGRANQINDSGNFVGYYTGDDGLTHGYYGVGAHYQSDIDLGVSVGSVLAYGLNNLGWVTGYAQFEFDGNYHAFLLVKGNVTLIDYPGAGNSSTRPLTINDEGLIGGNYTNGNQRFAFTYDSATKTFKTIKVKKSQSAGIGGLNAGAYGTVTSDKGPFILCPVEKAKCAVKD